MEEMEDKKSVNEIVEIDENEEIMNTQYDVPLIAEDVKIKDNKQKKKKKKLSKKAKIIISVAIVVILLIIIIAVVLLMHKNNKDDNVMEPEVVLVDKDNYTYASGTLILKENGKEIGRYDCTYKDENLCYVAYYSNDDFDETKKVFETKEEIETRSDIINSFAFIHDYEKDSGGKIKLFSIQNNRVVEEYVSIKDAKDNYVIVETLEDKYNVLVLEDGKYKNLFSKDYEYIGMMQDTNYLVVANNGNYALYDFDGKKVSSDVPGKIYAYNDSNISVASSNKKYVYDFNGTKKIEDAFDYIRFVDNYIITVSSKKLSVYDNEGYLMSKDAITLTKDEYNTLLIFDDDLNQKGKEVAFDAYLVDGNLKIEYDDTFKIINMLEGNINKTLSYVNYFDGILYFYSDVDKSNLLGSYTCTNKNDINSSTTELTNCYLARESNIIENSDVSNYIPIYNKRFVFILDGDKVVLWNLKLNKEVVTYKEVDAGYHKNDTDVAFIDTAGTVIVAKNTKDSYGAVNLKEATVSQITGFKDASDSSIINTEIKYVKDDIMVKRSNGTYHLYDVSGKEITSSLNTKYEIVDYTSKYVTVKNNNKYLIYSLTGTIISNEYKKIYMLDNAYIAISDDNLLGVYKYNSKDNLITSNIYMDNDTINYDVNGNTLSIIYTANNNEYPVNVTIE